MSTRPSLAADFFQRIVDHPGHPNSVAFLRSLVNSTPPTDETEYLDFKSASVPAVKSDPEKDLPDNDIKKIWSEAVAGFANTSGGVFIWGIDARKPPGGKIDQASGFNLALKPFELKSRLKVLQHQTADPPVPDIKIEAFEDPAEGGKGFVVCYVPESAYKPHRAELGSGKRWVMRIGDSFVDVPPSVLRSLFYPHRHSYLFMRANNNIRVAPNVSLKTVAKANFSPRLYNEGPATIENLFVLVKHVEGMTVNVPRSWPGGRGPTGWEVQYPNPIHPGQMAEFCGITVEFPVDTNGKPEFNVSELPLEFQFYARDQVPFQILLRYSAEELLVDAFKVGLPEPISVDRFR